MWIKTSEKTLININDCNSLRIVRFNHLQQDGSPLWSVEADTNFVNPVNGYFMNITIGNYASKEDAEAVLSKIIQGIQDNVRFIELKEKQVSIKTAFSNI